MYASRKGSEETKHPICLAVMRNLEKIKSGEFSENRWKSDKICERNAIKQNSLLHVSLWIKQITFRVFFFYLQFVIGIDMTTKLQNHIQFADN